MSFIFDEQTWNDIIKAAFPKLGQQAPGTINPELLPKLVRRLDAELSPAATDTFSIGKGDEETGAVADEGRNLTLKDLTLDNLLKFLANNKIIFNDAQGPKLRIVYPEGEFKTSNQEYANFYDKVGEYMVNPALLANYIRYLQGSLKKKNNPLINAYMKLLVDDVNTKFPDANISRNQDKPLPPEFPDDTVLDNIGVIFSDEEPVDGPNALTVGDLKSKEALNAWLLKHQAQVVVDNQGKKSNQFYDKIKDFRQAYQTILNSLYKRADHLREQKATSPDLAKKYDYYKHLLRGLGAAGGGGGFGSGTGGATQNVGYGQQFGNMSAGSFNNIIDALPLANDINLFRIETFFDTVKRNYTDPRTLPVINSYMTAAENAIGNLKGITNNLNIVQENTLPKDFAYMLKGSTANYGPALNLLYAIVNNTRQVIATINSSFGSVLSAEQKNKLSDQIDFYYGKNRALLGDLLRDANQVAR